MESAPHTNVSSGSDRFFAFPVDRQSSLDPSDDIPSVPISVQFPVELCGVRFGSPGPAYVSGILTPSNYILPPREHEPHCS